MKEDRILSDIFYLFKAEETWDNSQDIHEKRYGLETVKFIIWYLVSVVAALLVCRLSC